MSIRVGVGGWVFEPWRNNFYPKGLSQKRELEYASRRVNSIEINGTFYSLQRPKNFAELSGQEHVVRALSNALERGRLRSPPATILITARARG